MLLLLLLLLLLERLLACSLQLRAASDLVGGGVRACVRHCLCACAWMGVVWVDASSLPPAPCGVGGCVVTASVHPASASAFVCVRLCVGVGVGE